MGIPRLYAAASLKRQKPNGTFVEDVRIPRLYAAASLKHLDKAFCYLPVHDGIPRLYAAASLKHRDHIRRPPGSANVFRGFMPRPH